VRLNGVEAMDVLGPVLERFAIRLKLTPLGKPGLSARLEKARQREIEAVDFAFRHDDGQRVEDLDRAEVVLVGVSRTKKTPTMLYLAYRGWFAANVPIVPDLPLPASLLALPAERVFCLTMAANRLRELRVSRARDSGIPVGLYASLEQIDKELFYAERLREKHGWQRIDVTEKSVEEASRDIIASLSRSRSDSRETENPGKHGRNCD
jgi:regulator of PEP synthase PpsR (kinase-PPPase family)